MAGGKDVKLDYRLKSFNQKFASAQVHLKCNDLKEITSIKYRGMGNYSDYKTFLHDVLEHQFGFSIDKVTGDFQGNAWKVTDQYQNSVIIVEHETGLEILYIAGSIASLLSLIPLINSGWKYLRNRFLDRPFPNRNDLGIEIRTIDKNKLLEKRIIRIEDHILSESLQEITSLKERVKKLEAELIELNKKKASSKTSTKKKGKK
jgi:hypothetical protein